AGAEHSLQARLLSPKALPQRLRESWQLLGLCGGDSSTSASLDSADARKRARMETMRQRQQAMLRRMQQQQKEAAEELGSPEGDADGAAGGGSADEPAKEAWQCATCREVSASTNPLAVLAA
ncbi:unnamed protein product, partial [Polarella glacialis]